MIIPKEWKKHLTKCNTHSRFKKKQNTQQTRKRINSPQHNKRYLQKIYNT